MSAALSSLSEVTSRDPKPYKNVIPSFVSILKQVQTPLKQVETALAISALLKFCTHRNILYLKIWIDSSCQGVVKGPSLEKRLDPQGV